MKKGMDLLSIHDITTNDVLEILELAAFLKTQQRAGITHHLLKGKTLGMIFEKSSTRTRISFETGMYQLGGNALFLSNKDLQLGRGELVKDTARVLSRYLDGIMIRTYKQETVEEMAQFADIPVINALSDLLHPCQALTDLLTIIEYKGRDIKGIKLAYIGDGNNMSHSLMYVSAKMGMNCVIATPPNYAPDSKIIEYARADAAENNAYIAITTDPLVAAKDADVIITDTWVSMGQEDEHDMRRNIFQPYQVNADLLRYADKNVIVMHCLPAYRGEEITEEVFERFSNVIFDEAENRLHTQKAIMALIM